ncbi:MaoC/PaaZ C-terminal domain-containing protein [Natrinema longum]|uniref:Monoamine oxidase n=1 Tax=Natrinema longum TaxID=370324 RepID=A0A8A2U9S6_9EURY|nr:MaoC/PaaZ C-terminal domain-containing protein [Natrinema longum]MBZ6496720.1 monoamine oxidase [Natrinema longum]QSW85387.1 monoamine oxidase [Natrinema longum]
MSSTSDADAESFFEQTAGGDRMVTQGRTITEADVTNFAGVSGDFNHLHTDGARMADSSFGERIAHGMLVLSAATGLIWQTRSTLERESVVAFYGMDDLRFTAPTFIGDTIRVEREVLETERTPDAPGTGTVRYQVDVIKDDETTVLSCEMTSLVD